MEVAATSVGRSLLNCLLGQAKSAIAEDAASKQAVQRDLVFLTDELPEMHSLLRDIDEQRRYRIMPRSRVEQHLRDLAYDVEDCLDDYVVHLKNPSGWRFAKTLLERQRIAQEMKGLRARVEDMSQRNRRYRFAALHPNSQPAAFSAERPSNTVGPDGQLDLAAAIFGIDEARLAARYMNERVDLLQLINSKEEELKVIAVWGTMGDIGQTSIIRAAYDDPSVQFQFPSRAWVRVMHPFNPKDFVQSLVNQFHAADQGVKGLFVEDKTEQDLAQEFQRYVNDSRCLIVLNDLSTIEEWDHIKRCFRNHKKGSRIIVSTTQVEVASLCAGQERRVSELKLLSPDHSLYAFYEHKVIIRAQDTFRGFEPYSLRWPFYRPWVAGCCPSSTTLVASVAYAAWGLHVPVGAAARARARTVYVAFRT